MEELHPLRLSPTPPPGRGCAAITEAPRSAREAPPACRIGRKHPRRRIPRNVEEKLGPLRRVEGLVRRARVGRTHELPGAEGKNRRGRGLDPLDPVGVAEQRGAQARETPVEGEHRVRVGQLGAPGERPEPVGLGEPGRRPALGTESH
ncbi:Uncharacterised protein [Chlamydia trachomatis]|nr:Uncharacterised protein [Chlamydia trachomatis]